MTTVYHTCPKCNFLANTTALAKEHFGYRKVGDTKYLQSFCRVCKLENSREMREVKKDPQWKGLDLRVFK